MASHVTSCDLTTVREADMKRWPTPCQYDISERYNVEEDGGEQEDANSHPAEKRHTPIEQAGQERQ